MTILRAPKVAAVTHHPVEPATNPRSRAAGLSYLFVGQRLRGLATKIEREDLVTLTELIEAGSVTPVIDRTYPLIEAPDAIRYLEEGHARGKIVVTV